MEWELKSLGRKITIGLILSLLLLFSNVLVIEMQLPEAKGSPIFSDNFNNLNNWHIIDGVWSVSAGVLQGISTNNAESLIWAGNTACTNYQVTANIRIVNAGDASLVIRYNGPTNFYWLGLGNWGHKYSISKVVNGVYQELASSGLVSELEVGRWYLVSAVAVDTKLQLFVDGVKVLEVQDSSISNGAIGFRNWANTMQAEYLNVQSLTWSKTYGGIAADRLNSVVQSSDGGYAMTGATRSYGAGIENV